MTGAPVPATSSASAFAARRLLPFFLAGYAILALPAVRDGGMSWPMLAVSACLGAALAALSAIDLASFRLPDRVTLPLIAAGPALAWAFGWEGGVAWRMVAAALGYLSLYAVALGYERLRGRAGLGLGDAKLFAAAGAWLGAEALVTVMLWGTGIALLAIVVAKLTGRAVARTTRVPFGPFLALGFWLVWLYGPLA